MTHSAPNAPYVVTPARVDAGPIWLITDAHDRIITSAFEASLAGFVADKLNHRCDDRYNDPVRINPLVASMLCAFRLHLEHENGGPLVNEPDVPLLLADLCDWFGFNTGERAMALGPEMLAYLNRIDGEMPDVADDQPIMEHVCIEVRPGMYVDRGDRPERDVRIIDAIVKAD